MAIAAYQHVLGLEISMDDTMRVEMLQSSHKVRKVKLWHLVVEAANLLETSAKVTALHVLHDHVEVLATLKVVDAPDDEVVVKLSQDLAFVHDEVLHVLFYHDFLLKDFDCEDVFGLLESSKNDLTVGSAWDRLK